MLDYGPGDPGSRPGLSGNIFPVTYRQNNMTISSHHTLVKRYLTCSSGQVWDDTSHFAWAFEGAERT